MGRPLQHQQHRSQRKKQVHHAMRIYTARRAFYPDKRGLTAYFRDAIADSKRTVPIAGTVPVAVARKKTAMR